MTTTLTGLQWLAVIGLALLLPLVIEAGKWIRRRRMRNQVLSTPSQRSRQTVPR